MSETIAVIFDFDDTLLPDSTTLFLESRGIDSKKFWKVDAKKLLDEGYEPTLAYLNLIIDYSKKGNPLAGLKIEELKVFGQSLDDKFFPGVKDLRSDLMSSVKEISADIDVEMYIISGGLQDVMLGSKFVQETFKDVYGCCFGTNDEGVIATIKRSITFTEKTRFLFEINKGITPKETTANQYLVNKHVKEEDRRIHFQNMIYIGDGLTDIPCFSLINKGRGTPFGVFDPKDSASAKKAFLEFLKTDRVVGTHSPKFGKEDDLGALLRSAVSTVASRIRLQKELAMKLRQ